uniref:Uncharacterized protein n=1 Tax=Arundo donax TaxID=35708 RepID=A0A0A9HH05_ARUDO
MPECMWVVINLHPDAYGARGKLMQQTQTEAAPIPEDPTIRMRRLLRKSEIAKCENMVNEITKCTYFQYGSAHHACEHLFVIICDLQV